MEFLKSFLGYQKYKKLPFNKRQIIFYSEGDFQWQYFEKIIQILCNKGYEICYMASEINDRGLLYKNDNFNAFYVGLGFFRTLFFLNLDAKILLMSMPDLESFHIKRSKVANVHYGYIFHACVSTHMMYNEKAFDNFDSIFCVGPHHFLEIEKREKDYNLKKKLLLKHGSQRLDDIINNNVNTDYSKNNILLAPTWGENAIIESGEGEKIISELLNNNFKVTLRPHPETKKLAAELLNNLRKKFISNENFLYDDDIYSSSSLKHSKLMITDSSGIIFDYALGYLKPIIFIKKCYKVRNENYKNFAHQPAEISIRKDVGVDYIDNDYTKLPLLINEMINNEENLQKLKDLRQKYIFNIQNSANVAAEHVINILNNL